MIVERNPCQPQLLHHESDAAGLLNTMMGRPSRTYGRRLDRIATPITTMTTTQSEALVATFGQTTLRFDVAVHPNLSSRLDRSSPYCSPQLVPLQRRAFYGAKEANVVAVAAVFRPSSSAIFLFRSNHSCWFACLRVCLTDRSDSPVLVEDWILE